MIAPVDSADMIEPIEANEPTDSAEPMEPIEMTDPFDAMERSESCERIDHLEFTIVMIPVSWTVP